MALSWIGCGSAAAIAPTPYPLLDRTTQDLVGQAHYMAREIHYEHYEYDSASSYKFHCAAQDRYDELEARFYAALGSGNLVAAKIIGDALGHLGEELAYDDYLADKHFGGYDWCFCRFVDAVLGDHYAFVDFQYGYSDYRWGLEDFNGTAQGSVLGVGGGIAIPLTQRLNGFVRLGAYETFGSRIDLISARSDFSARTEWLLTAEAGLAAPISDRFGVRVSGGFALADLKVFGPRGLSDSNTVPGFTVDGGIDYKVNSRWKVTFDARYTQLEDHSFHPSPDVTLPVTQRMFAATLGLRYTLGNTARDKIW